ncbi:MAG: response regulator [Rickettsiella sp.]|nr:response regulator [Rickettsiella sp.]
MTKKNKNLNHILLVDDDSLYVRVVTQYLDEADYHYEIARDGAQAWNYLQAYPNKFFVVLADRIMPKLHGLALLAKMQESAFNDIPLILSTGESSKEERCEALRQGVYDFLYKPLSKDLLLAILKKVKKLSK